MRSETSSLPGEYIFTLVNFVVNNQEHFQTNSAIHSVKVKVKVSLCLTKHNAMKTY
jgi:hypothetical protein